MITVAVLGGGNGGFAAAAHLSSDGHRVHLYNRSPETIRHALDAGGIRYSGVLGEGFASLPLITSDLKAALDGADLVMVCLPAVAFQDLAQRLAPLLAPTVPVLLNPGSTGGALAFHRSLRAAGCRTIPPLAETNTLTYICRKRDAEEIYVSSVVRNVRIAALPATALDGIVPLVRRLYPTVKPLANVLHTSLSNLNAVLHPPGVILAAAWIEHTEGDFRYYYDAGTPAVAQVMGDLDRERLAIGQAWGITLDSLPVLFADVGSTSPEAGASGSYLRILRESEPNKFIKAPPHMNHRYIREDIPFGLVPMAELGQVAGVDTPVMESLIILASSINRTAYRAHGWTRGALGIGDRGDDATFLAFLSGE